MVGQLLVFNHYAVSKECAKLSVRAFCLRTSRFLREAGIESNYLVCSYLSKMEWLWISLGIILIIIGILGSFLPLLPGPPIAYAGLLIQLFREPNPFSTKFILIWGGIVAVTLVLDYLIPVLGTKKFGGSKYGVWGCTIGFLLAFWMGPAGVIIGPFLGAFVGELIGGKDSKKSFKAALGSFVGFLLGSFLKLVVCFMMLYYVIASA